jgi:hypothetical protein
MPDARQANARSRPILTNGTLTGLLGQTMVSKGTHPGHGFCYSSHYAVRDSVDWPDGTGVDAT